MRKFKIILKINIDFFKSFYNKAIYFPVFPLVGLGLKPFK